MPAKRPAGRGPAKASSRTARDRQRPARSATQHRQNYQEADDDDDDFEDDEIINDSQDEISEAYEEESQQQASQQGESEPDELPPARTNRKSLVLKLPLDRKLRRSRRAKSEVSIQSEASSAGPKGSRGARAASRASRETSTASAAISATRPTRKNAPPPPPEQLSAVAEDDETVDVDIEQQVAIAELDTDTKQEQAGAAQTVEDDDDDDDFPIVGGRRNPARREEAVEATPEPSPTPTEKRVLTMSKSKSKSKKKDAKKASRRSNDDDDDEFNPESSDAGSADDSAASEADDDPQEAPMNDFIDDDETFQPKRSLRPKRSLDTAFAAEVLVREERRSRPKGPMTAGLPQYVNAALDSGWGGVDDGQAIEIEARQPSKRRKLWKNTDIMPSISGPFGRLGPEDLEALNPGLDKSGIDPDYFDDEVSTLGRVNNANASHLPLDQEPKTSPLERGSPPPKGSRKHAGDFDPVSVDTNVTFDDVGGRADEIARLRQMVIQPLMYPEMFASKGIKPPRGVLFHGPPGTGKTMIARALAAEMSRSGQKVAFFQRKGSDALSKWVGEAERNLKDLFETARKQQPAIIFFDEIDGLAPVRSSKSDQIYASIVSTLLALMDGIDDRGQVIIIGATNRPDNLDPALRRGGRFDVEYHFSLPDESARTQILNNITKKWDQDMDEGFLGMIARMTSGYAGADLSSLCTEAALNSMQRTYPQIYETDRKLLIEVKRIKVIAKDFKMAMRKVRPASERTGNIPAKLLDDSVVPLLEQQLKSLNEQMEMIMPLPDKTTALEDAKFEQPRDEDVAMQQDMDDEFRDSMVYRPRLLLTGLKGMGQKHLAKAILHKYESIYHKTLSLGTLDEDSGLSHGAAINKLLDEARRQKPSIVYIPDLKQLYKNVEPSALAVLRERLDELGPHEAVMVLAIYEKDADTEQIESDVLHDIFSVGSEETLVDVSRPGEPQRRRFMSAIVDKIRKAPTAFPSKKRKQRQLEELEQAPVAAAAQSSEELEEHYDRFDRKNTLLLKNFLDPLKKEFAKAQTYRLFNAPVVPEEALVSLKSDYVGSDVNPVQYEFAKDKWGHPGYRDLKTHKFFYNLDLNIIENRLHNGYYARMKDMYADFKRLYYDYAIYGPQEKAIKALELMYNVEADVTALLRTAHGSTLEANGEKVLARRKAWEKQQDLKKPPDSPLIRRGTDNSMHQTSNTFDGGIDPIYPSVAQKQHALSPSTRPLREFLAGELVDAEGHTAKRRRLNVDEQERFGFGSARPQDLRPSSRHFSPRGTAQHSHPVHSNTASVREASDTSADLLPNGQQNGTTGHKVTTQLHGDVVMGNSPEEILDHAQHSAQNTQNLQARSQKSAITTMDAGSQLTDYHNSASTTTSGNKTNHSSGPSNGTQASNGVHQSQKAPEFDEVWTGGSQLPDTQEMGLPPSSQSRPGSQAMPPPRAQQYLSNSKRIEAYDKLPVGELIIDDAVLQDLLHQLVERTSGCSVEQLENIYATMMGVIWRYRDEWNRTQVAKRVTEAFNKAITSIDSFQRTLQPSQD